MAGKLFIISAPSGAGKTTLVHHCIMRLQENHVISRVVTYTTKPPREGEARHGIDYHFISQADFEKKIGESFFIEWSTAYGHYYGTPTHIISGMAQGYSYILIVDRSGAQSIKERIPEAVLIWIYTSNVEVLRQRLLARGGDCSTEVERRLSLAISEIEHEMLRPYYNFHVLNEDFYETLAKLSEIFNFFLQN